MKAKAKAKEAPEHSRESVSESAITPESQAAKKPLIPGPSKNPLTNLVIADLVLRAGTRLARHALERGVLGTKYPPEKARKIVKSRNMAQTLVGTAVARVATGSVPGAILVGGVLLAKTLYDLRQDRELGPGEVAAEGETKIQEQADKA